MLYQSTTIKRNEGTNHKQHIVLQQCKNMKLNDAFSWTLVDGLLFNIESGTKLQKYGFIIIYDMI